MFSSVRFFYGVSIALSVLSASPINAQIYSADLNNSEWKADTNPFACSLTHKIPNFGKAVFSRKAGGVDVFYLESQGKAVFPPGQTVLETAPPAWRSDILPVRVAEVNAVAGNQPISLTAAQIEPMAAQLSAGMNLMYSSQLVAAVSSSSSLMRVVLTAKNFAPAYKTYQQCVADIIPYSFAQVARTSIGYAEKSTALTAANKSDLNKVARYVQADAKVVGVFVDGHSDNLGTPEIREATSKQVAEWVSAYLNERGVAADKITTRWHADKFLIAKNTTEAGRAQNRRVTVRLEDEASHKEFLKKEEENRKADEKANQEKAAVDEKKSEVKAADAKTSATTNTSTTTNATANSSSSRGRMSPEEISRMVEGYDITQ
ncbi:MAG: OmpA family protein [Cellvibrio sp.]